MVKHMIIYALCTCIQYIRTNSENFSHIYIFINCHANFIKYIPYGFAAYTFTSIMPDLYCKNEAHLQYIMNWIMYCPDAFAGYVI